MGRLALRPALRAYAHAPAGVEEEFSPGDISGTILWVDPSDSSTITTTSGTPGTDGEDTTSITDKIAGKVFSHPSGYWLVYGAYTDATAGSLGNGLAFLKSPNVAYQVGSAVFTPSASPYNDVTTGGVNSEWTVWYVMFGQTGLTYHQRINLARGSAVLDGNPMSELNTSGTSQIRAVIRSPWGDVANAVSPQWNSSSTPAYVHTEGRAQLHIIQSTYTGGAWTYRMSQDGANWIDWVHGRTPGTVTATENKWQISIRNWNTPSVAGLGEMGFINGSVADSTLQTLHGYLKSKWDLYT